MTTRFVTCHHLIAKKQRKKPIESKLERERERERFCVFCCRFFFHSFALFFVLRKDPVKDIESAKKTNPQRIFKTDLKNYAKKVHAHLSQFEQQFTLETEIFIIFIFVRER
jgi:hypothetical protein